MEENPAVRDLILERIAGESGDVVVIVWYRYVSLRVGVVVVAGSTVKREEMSPVMQGSMNDTGEESFRSRRWVWQDCPCHGCSPAKENYHDFVFPPVLKRFRRPVPTGGNVCCVLKRSNYGWVRSPILCPDKRAMMNALCRSSTISLL